MTSFQPDYSKGRSPELYDLPSRETKAKKIIAVLADHCGLEALGTKTALDLGCSAGVITNALSTHFKMTYGVDTDDAAIAHANRAYSSERLRFQIGDALQIDFPDSSFDVIVCSQVYACVSDPARLMAEIHRLLRVGGICYFAASNRLSLRDSNYRLPLLSLIPKSLAHFYLRYTNYGEHYYDNQLSFWGLRRLTSAFRIIDYTEKVLCEPRKFYLEDKVREGSLLHWIIMRAIRPLYFACPSYIWLLKKTPDLPRR